MKFNGRFSDETQVLVSTDAGGEGLNLQFCHVVFNYDLPWNPMKLEQRIGRVDRIGQAHVVRAQNFALEDTVELRVREVLEEKLARILEEFGVDKLADVLDSEEGGVDFENLYVAAVLDPEEAETRAIELAERVRKQAEASQDGSKLLGSTDELDPSAARGIAHHRLPYWTERMTISYLNSRGDQGGDARADDTGYRLQWPNGDVQRRAVFSRQEAEKPGTALVSLEDAQVRRLTARFTQFAPGQPLVSVLLEGISDKVAGDWSLWRIALRARNRTSHRMMPLFISEEGRLLAPTARAVWDRLIDLDGSTHTADTAPVTGDAAMATCERARIEAERQGKALFSELMAAHRDSQDRQRQKGRRAFEARRKTVERIGLPEVRNHRLQELEREEADWRQRFDGAGCGRARVDGAADAPRRTQRSDPVKDTPAPSAHAMDWRSSILEHFTPEIAGAIRLTIVADPDQLLTEQAILGELIRRGFGLLPLEDPVAFRFAYESRYRQIWDCGETTNLVVVLRSTSGDLNSLPFDLLEQARSQGAVPAVLGGRALSSAGAQGRAGTGPKLLRCTLQRPGAGRSGQARRERHAGLCATSRIRHLAGDHQYAGRPAAGCCCAGTTAASPSRQRSTGDLPTFFAAVAAGTTGPWRRSFRAAQLSLPS